MDEQCKQQIERLERDLEYKEVERHRACRDYDRLTKHIEHNGMTIPESLGSGAKQNSTANEGTVSAPVAPAEVTAIKREDASEREKHHGKVVAQLRCDSDILRKKLFQERDTTDKLKKEIEQFKASESTVSHKFCIAKNIGLLMLHDIAVEARRGPVEADP